MEKELPKLRIKEILNEKGMTSKELAEKMGKSKQYISNILTGGKGMSIATLVEIAKILDIEFRDLFAFTRDNHSEINGYIKVKDEIYEIRSYEDLEKIINLRNDDKS
jgi:transcriptional regulator with XRE-family HTH domain